MTTPKNDDLDAVRAVVDAIKDFKSDEQQRIFRWAAEKLGLPQPFGSTVHAAPTAAKSATSGATETIPAPPASPGSSSDIKSFMAAKRPSKDIQFAAAVAYYYRFEAVPADRKDAIDKDDLQEATRKAGRERFGSPLATLNNAHKLGLLDRGAEKGTFTINSVGENLVAMTLPGGGNASSKRRERKQNSKNPQKRSTKKTPGKRKQKG
jgi:hypothetical protein